jgi:hypothetical protein
MIDELLASRYARALEGSRERADKHIATWLGWRLALVRIEASGDDGHWEPLGESAPELAAALDLFRVDDVHYFGGGERVVQLRENDQTEDLALRGHLQRIGRTGGREYRMIAV